ncbi:type II toxin-antitoxin system HicB family antitoxin [Candidatus Poribacteria bacterium]|nr:type II toxin-antitoxin system HicB family antitoxin [Candidatus Poribacteria bacterium]
MRYTVFLQDNKDSGYIAQVPSWPGCVGEGRTREEALENIRKALKEMLKNVIEITQVEVDIPKTGKTKSDPWLEFRGMFADDPDFDDFLLEIEAYRKELNNE